MLLDHINTFLLDGSNALLFTVGRCAMPIFGVVLMNNLARPDAWANGVHLRVMKRLFCYGILAMPAYVALRGWWPANILLMLLLATLIVWLIEDGRRRSMFVATALFIGGGAWVEFWWFGLSATLSAWAYCKRPSWSRLTVWVLAVASLQFVNDSAGALMALPLIWIASKIVVPLQRYPVAFYIIYPAHLTLIWAMKQIIES